MHYLYLLRSRDGTLYAGYTTDLERRLTAHNAGKGAKYTCGRRPVELGYSEVLPDKSAALRREHALKQLTRAQKLALVQAFQPPSAPHHLRGVC